MWEEERQTDEGYEAGQQHRGGNKIDVWHVWLLVGCDADDHAKHLHDQQNIPQRHAEGFAERALLIGGAHLKGPFSAQNYRPDAGGDQGGWGDVVNKG